MSSIYRWQRRVDAYKATGNADRTCLVGTDLLLLVIFFTIHPTADQDKCAAFIFNEGGGLYSRQAISKRMNEFGFSKKIGSIEAYQAYTAENIHRVH